MARNIKFFSNKYLIFLNYIIIIMFLFKLNNDHNFMLIFQKQLKKKKFNFSQIFKLSQKIIFNKIEYLF